MMRIVTWNVNSLRIRADHLGSLLDAEQPDIVCLQETKVPDSDFPTKLFEQRGYDCIYSGQRTYNGVAILVKKSNLPATQVVCDIAGFEDPQRRILAVTLGSTRIINLYIPNGQSVGSEKYQYKMRWLDHVFAWLITQSSDYEKMCVVGDFNITASDADIYDPEDWHEKIMCSTPERQRLSTLMEKAALYDLVPEHEEAQQRYTWWDYRAHSFRRKMGMRIDLTLLSAALAKDSKARVGLSYRRSERPSDHAPVIVDVNG